MAKTTSTDLSTPRQLVLPGNLKQIAVAEIRRMIFARELQPGARIEQEAIADQIGMSKIPVREALSALVAEGLVEMIPRRGAFVVPLTKQDVEDQYWLLAHISGRAAELATQKMTEDALDELTALADAMERAATPSERQELTFRFHSLINHAADAPRITAVLRILGSPIPVEFYESSPDTVADVDAEHRALLAAFRTRSSSAARSAMEQHFLGGAEYAIDALEAQGFWND
ncbi:GntR family transcriptional regulator [Tsukamurella sp. NPDC003166]|uniref:GntR family transcriptional regulator n=1 Tax=Tsukamurella sp. NPDC003166 TaxID=3154444 RepID=UPI0033A2AD53